MPLDFSGLTPIEDAPPAKSDGLDYSALKPLDYSGLRPAEPQAPPPAEADHPGIIGTALRAAERGFFPALGGAAGMGAGAEAGAAVGALGGPAAPITVPLGTLAGALLGGWLASYGTGKAQQAALAALPPEAVKWLGQSEEQQQADIAAHRVPAIIGELFPNLLLFGPGTVEHAASEGAGLVTQLFAHPVTGRVLGAGMMGGQEAIEEKLRGEPLDPTAIGISAGAGAFMQKPTVLGERALAAGARPVQALTGRAASPAAQAEAAQPSAEGMPDVGSVVGFRWGPDTPPQRLTVGPYSGDGKTVQITTAAGDSSTIPVTLLRSGLTAAPEAGDQLPRAPTGEETPPAAEPPPAAPEAAQAPPATTAVPEAESKAPPVATPAVSIVDLDREAQQGLTQPSGTKPSIDEFSVAQAAPSVETEPESADTRAREALVQQATAGSEASEAPVDELSGKVDDLFREPQTPEAAAPLVEAIRKDQEEIAQQSTEAMWTPDAEVEHIAQQYDIPTRGITKEEFWEAYNRRLVESGAVGGQIPLFSNPENEAAFLEAQKRLGLTFEDQLAAARKYREDHAVDVTPTEPVEKPVEGGDYREHVIRQPGEPQPYAPVPAERGPEFDRPAPEPGPLLEPALRAAVRGVGIRGMEGETAPDPVAQDILGRRNTIAKALPQIDAQLRAEGVTSLTPLGYGFSSVVFDAGDGRVLRIGGVITRPDVPEYLQALKTGAAEGIKWELLPKLDTSGISESDVAAMQRALAARGLWWTDPGTDNLGRLPDGRVVILDGGIEPAERIAGLTRGKTSAEGAQTPAAQPEPVPAPAEPPPQLRLPTPQVTEPPEGTKYVLPSFVTAPHRGGETVAGEHPQIELAGTIAQRLATNPKPISANELYDMARPIYGGGLAEGRVTRADLYDALELGVNRYLRSAIDRISPNVDLAEAKHTVAAIADLKNRLPTQTVRAGEKDSMQQFSTPPDYAYTAAWVADIRPDDRVLEPSAGTGSLVAHAMNARPREVTVNELSTNRAPLVESLQPDRSFRENAEQLHNILPADVKPTLVLMNPPFSQTAGRMGTKMVAGTGAVHVEQALQRLEPGGRLVAIVGRGMKMEGTGVPGRAREGTGAQFRDWWRNISQNYDVRANLGIPGSVYGKYGTQFGTQLLVIDKVPPSGRPVLTGEAASLPEAMERLDAIRQDRPAIGDTSQSVAAEPLGEAVARPGEAPVEPGPPVSGATPLRGVRGEPVDTGARPELPGGPGAGSEPTPRPRPEPGGRDEVVPQQPAGTEPGGAERHPETPAGAGEVVGGGGAEPDGVVLRPEGGAGPVLPAERVEPTIETAEPPPPAVRVDELAAEPQPGTGMVEAVYEPYQPQRIKIEGAVAHPGKLVQSAAMASVMPPRVDYAPRLPRNLITSGALSDAQLEAVTYAGNAHAQILPAVADETPFRRGFFIGDGTGVGKGRELAGIIMDNTRQGRAKHLWISETPSLVRDARRDWSGIGGKPTDVFELSKIKAGADIQAKSGIGFLTYDTLKSYERAGKDESGKTIQGQRRIDQLVKWLGSDFDGVIAFDESHNLANSMAVKGERGVKDAAAKAMAGVELQQKLPNARVVYVSATGATEVLNLGYAERLGLWGRNTPFPDKRAFISKISEGGIAAMELVARDMKAMGHYLSRNLSYDDVKYDRVEHSLTPQQKEIYDGLAEGWQNVLQNIGEALQATAPRDEMGRPKVDRQQRSNALSAFWSGHQRFFNQVITSMQMPSVIAAVERDMAEGRQAVLQLVNTNEASQKRAIQKRAAAEGADAEDLYEDLDLTPRDQLMQMIDKSFPTQQMETFEDENGNERTRAVTDSAGNPVHNPQAVAMKEALLDKVGGLRVPDGPLEILLNHFGPDKVAEVTGRGQRVVHKPDERGVVKATLERRSKQSNEADADAFQNGKKPILVFSQAGGTGRSYHAENGTASAGNQRSHYLVQAGWRADKAIQGFGRTHRTNQDSAPIFHLVTTDLQGQKRFISSIARRLSQLGALTKGERRAGDQGLFSARDNLESSEARAALRGFWTDLQRNQISGIDTRDFERQTGLALKNKKGEYSEPPEITQFLNRLLSFKFDMQNQVFGEFDRRLGDAVDRAAASGTLDVGTETLRGDRIRKEDERTVYTDPQSGAETKYVRLAVDTKNHPASFEDVISGKRMTAGREPVFFARSKRSGKILAVSEASNATDAQGNVTEQYRLSGPLQWDYTPRQRLDDERYWERIDDQKQARQLWDQQLAAIPEYDSRPAHLITGAVLPIWDRLQGVPRVYRLQTDAGERMLGREIGEGHLAQTLRALGAETTGEALAPQDVANRVLEGGRATLANGWTLKRSMVAGEPRIEIVGPDYTHRAELEHSGVYTERIQYDTRFFVPTGEGAAETIGDIIARRPVTEMSSASRGLEETGTQAASEHAQFRDMRYDYSAFHRPDDPHGAAREWTTAQGNLTGHEHLVSLDDGGRPTEAYTQGLKSRVDFTPDLVQRLSDPTAGMVVHHNHPGGNSFSDTDIRQLALPGLDRILAHSPSDVFDARLTPELKMRAISDPQGTEAELGDSYDSAGDRVRKRLQTLVDNGRISPEDAGRSYHDLVNRALDAAGVTDYVSSHTPPLNEGMVRNIVRDAAQAIRQDHVTDEEFDARVHRSTVAVRPDEIVAGLPRGDEAVRGGSGRAAGDREDTGRTGAPPEEGRGLAQTPPPTGPPQGPPRGPGGGEPPDRRSADLRKVMKTTEPRGFVGWVRDWIDAMRKGGLTELRQRWLDQQAYLEKEEKKAGGGTLLPADVSPSVHQRLARNSMMTVEVLMQHSQVKYNPATKQVEPIPNTKGLIEIEKPLAAVGRQAVDDYQLWEIAKRASELRAEGREHLIPPEFDKYLDLDQLYNRPNGTNLFHQVHAERAEFHRNLLNFGEQTGILNPESRQLFERENYIPFYRLLDDEDVSGPRGGRTVRSPIRQLRGSETALNNVFENEVMLATAMTRRGMENIARRWTVAQLSGTEALTPLSKAARAELETPVGEQRLRDMGLDPAVMSAQAKAAARELWGALMRRDPNLYTVMQDGKPLHYKVEDPNLLRSINAMGPQSMDALTRILSGPARLLRSMVVFDPAFALAHNLRMAGHSFVLTGTSPFASIGEAIRIGARGLDPTALRLMSSGAISGKYDIDLPGNVRRQIYSDAYQATLLDTPLKAARFLQRMGENAMRASDLGPRVAVYKRVLRQTGSEAEALNAARDLLDFSTHGDGGAARFLAQTIPFLNARWQGLYRTGRGLIGDNRNAIMMRGAMVTAATIALWYENHDDPEYQQKEDWDKQYAWQIKAFGLWWRLPKFFELGALFGSVPEMILDYFDKDSPSGGSARQLQGAAASLFGNVFKFNPIPVAVRPIAEAYFNTDTYTGRPIVNEAEQHLAISDRAGPMTSPALTKLTQAYDAVSPLPIAPDTAQHLVRGYLAGWGGYITAAADAIGESAGWLPSQAQWRTTDYPVINRFVHENPQAGNRIQTDFYNLKSQVSQIAQSIKTSEEHGDQLHASQLLSAHPSAPGDAKYLGAVGLKFARERRQLNLTLQNPNVGAAEKRQALDRFYVQRDEQLRAIVPLLKRIDQGMSHSP